MNSEVCCKLPIGESYLIDWSKPITLRIESVEHLRLLILEGYEIRGSRFYFEINSGTLVSLALKKESDLILANANSISDYVVNLVVLYDFQKRRLSHVWVEDTTVYQQFEQALLMLAPWENFQQMISRKPIGSRNAERIDFLLRNWIEIERGRTYGNVWFSEIFSFVCVVKEKEQEVYRTVLSKELISLSKIHQLIESTKYFDNAIALSPFCLSEKLKDEKRFEDAIMGLIIYDLKKCETIAFNLQSVKSFMEKQEVDSRRGLHDVVSHMFQKCARGNGTYASYIPLPLHSPWYTVLPWLSYVNLTAISPDPSRGELYSSTLNIPEFFTFGFPSMANEGYSFKFNRFGANKTGTASCILNLNSTSSQQKYVLRFDTSPAEPRIHFDFSFYDSKERKLISHRPLNFEQVYNYNHLLFISMMFAGLFDGFFNTLLRNQVEGLQKLARRNPCYLYSLKYVWMADTAISWLERNRGGYSVLKKVYRQEELNKEEVELAKDMKIGDFSLVSIDKEHHSGLTYFGYMVFVRYQREGADDRLSQLPSYSD